MAIRKTIVIECDPCGGKPARPGEAATMQHRSFTADGQAYEADLCATHAEMFDRAQRVLTGYARLLGPAPAARAATRNGVASSGNTRRRTVDRARSAAVRAWWYEHEVPGAGTPLHRGRIPAAVQAAYKASR